MPLLLAQSANAYAHPPGGGYSPIHVYAHFQEDPPPLGGSATLSLRLPDTFRGVTCAGDVPHSG